MVNEFLTKACGPTLRSPKGGTVETSTLALSEVIGIYFSAHWCPPCRAFTPNLINLYKLAKEKNKSFEIIFVSLDKDIKQFEEYHSIMPWAAVPYHTQQRQLLPRAYNVSSIPTLVLFNKSGQIRSANATREVAQPTFIANLPDAIDFNSAIDNSINSLFSDSKLSDEVRLTGLKTIVKALSNILQHPGNPKFLKLKKSNEAFVAKLNNPHFITFLKMAGFHDTGDALCCDENADTAKIKEIVNVLDSVCVSLESK